MEKLEIHSKSFLIKWVAVPENSSVTYQIKPVKRSINLGLYRKISMPDLVTNSTAEIIDLSDDKSHRRRSVVSSHNTEPLEDRLQKNGLEKVEWLGRCEPDELRKGSFDVKAGSGGMYALVLDNTFSKSTAKTVMFSQRVVVNNTESIDRLTARPPQEVEKRVIDTESGCLSDGRHLSGILWKRKRKKLQGFAKRYFTLDYKYGTFNYYLSQNSSILRGSMPIRMCVVSAKESSRDIYIDSGMEVWNVRALNATDFKTWVAALEAARTTVSPYPDPETKKAISNKGNSSIPYVKASVNESNLWGKVAVLIKQLEQASNSAKNEANFSVSTSSLSPVPNTSSQPPQRRPSFWSRKGASSRNSVINSGGSSENVSEVPPTPSLENVDFAKLNLSSQDISTFTTAGSSSPTKKYVDEVEAVISSLKEIVKEALTLPSRTSPDNISLAGSEEFFDAVDGVVYLGESSDGEEAASEDEDDDSEDDDAYDEFDGPKSQLNTPNHTVIADVSDSSSGSSMPNDLYPLGTIPHVKHRTTIPPAVASPPNFLTIIRKNVGKDLSSVAMPVIANEPITVLQRFSEMFEYTWLFDKALDFSPGSPERIAYITTFAAVFASSTRAKERAGRKPFNPLLGETFELVREDQGMRMIAEKVSHRPLVMAFQAESKNWVFHYSPSPAQKIWGKSVELNNKGTLRLSILSSGEVYEWISPTTFLRNVIAGEKYSEPVGSLNVSSSNGWRSIVDYKAGGMFSGRSEELKGKVFEPSGTAVAGYELEGKWTDSIELATPKGRSTIWTVGNLVPDHLKRFGFTEYAAGLNEITEIEKGFMAPTDSRLRPDQRMYENGNVDEAERLKLELEQNQRERRATLEANGQEYEPIFFEKRQHNGAASTGGDDEIWMLKKGTKNYWERRRRGDWDGLVNLF